MRGRIVPPQLFVTVLDLKFPKILEARVYGGFMNSWLPLRAFEKPFQDRPKPALETPPLKSKTKKIFKVLKVSKDLRVTVGLTVV